MTIKTSNHTPLKIWVDGYEANVPQRLGSSQVAFELLKNLEKIDHHNEYTILLPTPPLDDLPTQRPGWDYKVLNPNKLWTLVSLPLALFTSKVRPDLFFSPTHYIPRFSPVKQVVTIFDLSYLHFPQMFEKRDLWKLTNWSKYSIIKSDHIITISNFSKNDIIKNYNVAKEKITVAYPGYGSELFNEVKKETGLEDVFEKYNLTSPYIIFVGTIQPRKNLIRLIEAFHQVLQDKTFLENHKLKLVLVGKITGQGRSGWKYEEILKKPHELGIGNRVIFTGFVRDVDLPTLIQGAKAFILPSLWEGFGIPVIDSMASGTPVIVSNTSSLPEIVGESGLLVDPTSIDQIAQAIRTIISDKKLHLKLSKLGPIQAKKYSWEKMAKQVLKVFETI